MFIDLLVAKVILFGMNERGGIIVRFDFYGLGSQQTKFGKWLWKKGNYTKNIFVFDDNVEFMDAVLDAGFTVEYALNLFKVEIIQDNYQWTNNVFYDFRIMVRSQAYLDNYNLKKSINTCGEQKYIEF